MGSSSYLTALQIPSKQNLVNHGRDTMSRPLLLKVRIMTVKSDALYEMAKRYQQAAKTEKNLLEAEKLTAKAGEFWDKWREAVK